ncbi:MULTISPECIES: KPN_02809 family neutral zinc metallopeptidase [Lichenihabitans]|uniref:KPN_02809 family neutral zinc metallopeptidase n=1 Tax=Lichenihabitans TaxID=2723776 RepID=UPI0010368A96|nr:MULTISPECIES: neutral zinc metallopeptidase [Lichenihabitans]UDL95887.1 neutral zinc metallopeptidase [Lichenihabitans sp. PAMC28606]
MRWEDSRRSDNIEDVRGGGDSGGGGGGFGIPMGGGGLGIGAIIILAIIGYVTGIDPRVLISGVENATNQGQSTQSQPYQRPDSSQFSQSQSQAPAQGQARRSTAPTDQMGDFVAAILGETEDVWSEVLPAQKGVQYVKPKLVLYSGVTRSGCGQAQSAMGPFYCPVDQKVYLDMSFFNDMKQKLGGGGDFAYAYVISHEIGHHVQNLLGILGKVRDRQEQASQQEANSLSVRIELMADCFAGVWANHADQKWHILEQGDVDKAIATAAAIGDDRLQKQSRGYAVPDSFTHGSSAQRQQWLTTGLKTGSVDACNTFKQ